MLKGNSIGWYIQYVYLCMSDFILTKTINLALKFNSASATYAPHTTVGALILDLHENRCLHQLHMDAHR